MELILNLMRFIIILGILIFIHELGHFVVAKHVGIYVFRFSIGFGKRLIGWKTKETDYCFSLIPFGGYVKMAGQEDVPTSEQDSESDPDYAVQVPEDQKFYNKTVLQRLAVVLAGPLMNFILGLVLFIVVFYVGMHVPAYLKSTVIGDVVDNSPAQASGLQIGDEILSINGKDISEWRQITRVTLFNINEQLDLKIKRNGDIIHAQVTPAYFNERTNPGIGIMPYIQTQVKDVIIGSPAEKKGMLLNDTIVAVNGKKVSFHTVVNEIRFASEPTISIDIIRDGTNKRIENILAEKIGVIKHLDFYQGVVVGFDPKVFPDLQLNDKILSIDSNFFNSDQDITEYLAARVNQEVVIALQRDTKKLFKKSTFDYIISAKVQQGNKIGVLFEPAQTTVLEKYPLHTAVWKGTQRTFSSGFELFAALYYLALGKISPRELAGPVGIYKITTDFAKSGFVMLLSLIAFLSVNLSIINMLPIPVLDGGHVLFLTIEGIRRKPLNERVVLICQKIGFALLMLLIVYTFYNDIVHRLIGK
ncbi:RIP metalloprotease RseP [bacterium]|nr:RIP metalloprotease RseP [bacterium]